MSKTPEQVSEILVNALARNIGPQKIVELAAQILENPVSITDVSLTALYTSHDMPEHGPYRTVLTELKIHGQIAGYMCVILSNHPLLEHDSDLIRLIRSVIETELGKNASGLSQPQGQRESTLLSLLSGKEMPLQNNADLTISLGIDKNPSLYALVFKPSDYSKDTIFELSIRRRLMELCESEFCVAYEGSIVVVRQGLLYQSKYLVPPFTDFTSFLKTYGIVCGISTVFSQISELRRHYLQALETAEYFEKRRGSGIYRCESAAAVRMLQSTPRPYEYCHPGILALKEYDQLNHTNYTQLLKIYIENEKNALITANKTHISKASVYRILEKIKTITGVSMKTPETSFSLYFSILLLEHQEETYV